MKRKIAALMIVLCMVLSVAGVEAFAAREYTDVTSGHWAYNNIHNATAMKWFDGYPDGTFRPGASITRAEAIKVFVVFVDLDYRKVNQSSYTDVKTSDWFSPYVEAGKGLLPLEPSIQGKVRFRPNVPITREEAMYALVTAMGFEGEVSSADLSVLNRFSDKNSISNSIKPYVAVAVAKGLVEGHANGTIGGQDPLTRAEFATLLYRAAFDNEPENPKLPENPQVPENSEVPENPETPEDPEEPVVVPDAPTGPGEIEPEKELPEPNKSETVANGENYSYQTAAEIELNSSVKDSILYLADETNLAKLQERWYKVRVPVAGKLSVAYLSEEMSVTVGYKGKVQLPKDNYYMATENFGVRENKKFTVYVLAGDEFYIRILKKNSYGTYTLNTYFEATGDDDGWTKETAIEVEPNKTYRNKNANWYYFDKDGNLVSTTFYKVNLPNDGYMTIETEKNDMVSNPKAPMMLSWTDGREQLKMTKGEALFSIVNANLNEYDVNVRFEEKEGISKSTAIPLEFNKSVKGKTWSRFSDERGDVWYKITVPQAGMLKISKKMSEDLKCEIIGNDGVAKPRSKEDECDIYEVSAGEYFIKVGNAISWSDDDGEFEIKVELAM